jgi:stage III sporulation protein AH
MKFLKRQMALIAVVAVIGLAIFLNWQLSNKPNADEVMSQQQSAAENSSHSSILGQAEFVNSNTEYFDAARLNRQESRQQAIDIADGILSSESATQEERDQAATQIMTLSNAADEEGRIENLIMAKGYTECVAFIGDENINIVVKSNGLSSNDVIAIKDIAVSQTEIDASSVKIIESK